MFEKILAAIGIKPIEINDQEQNKNNIINNNADILINNNLNTENIKNDKNITNNNFEFKKQNEAKQKTPNEINSSYLLNEKTQYLIDQNKLFKKTTTMLAILAIALAGGLIYTSQQSKEKPYVIMLDDNGRTLAKNKSVENLTNEQLEVIKTNRTIDVVTALKTVSIDSKIQKKMLDEMFNFILPGSVADKNLRKYLQDPETDPYKTGKDYTVTIEFQNVFPVSYENNLAYQIEWREHWTDKFGNFLRTDDYKGAVLYEFRKPKDAETMQKNPIGFYIKDMTFSRTIGKQKNPNENKQ